jgi:hypothetical protein
MLEGFIYRMLEALEASPSDLVIVLIGLLFALHTFVQHRRQQNTIEKLWAEIRHLDERYHRLDALNFAMSQVIKIKTGVKLIKPSANGDGDYTLNRD